MRSVSQVLAKMEEFAIRANVTVHLASQVTDANFELVMPFKNCAKMVALALLIRINTQLANVHPNTRVNIVKDTIAKISAYMVAVLWKQSKKMVPTGVSVIVHLAQEV